MAFTVGDSAYSFTFQQGAGITFNVSTGLISSGGGGAATVFSTTFDNDDLDGSNILTTAHSLGHAPASVRVVNPSGQAIRVLDKSDDTNVILDFDYELTGDYAGTYTVIAI